MPIRHQVLAIQEIYHIFNRSVGNETIFSDKRNFDRTLGLLDFYRYKQKIRYSQFKLLSYKAKEVYIKNILKQTPLVEIYAYAFMPNHYHLLLRQLQDKGIVSFISNLQNSLAKYFNLKRKRHGALFQNSFKAKWISTDEEFLHVSRYIHLNPVTSFIVDINKLPTYPWTSLPLYLEEEENHLIITVPILKHFKSRRDYLRFINDQADYQRRLSVIKHLVLE